MAQSFIRRLIESWTAEAKHEIEETVRMAVLYALAAIAALGAIFFATLVLYWVLNERFSAIPAALMVAGLYAAVAAILAIWASRPARPVPAASESEAPAAAATPDGAEAQSIADLSANTMGVDFNEVAGTLSDAGFKVETLVVLAARDFMRQLSPLQFVSLVFVASFFFGRRLRR